MARLALAAWPLARAFGKLDSHVDGVLIGAQSYSFRDRPLDAAIQGFIDVGLSECELSMGHVEPEFPRGPEGRAALRKWRLNVPPDDIRAIRRKFEKAGIELSEEECGRVYIQGLTKKSNPELALIFDRLPTPGGDHCHLPFRVWAPLGREVWLVGLGHIFVRESEWPEFSRKQVELLVQEGFERKEAERLFALQPS